MNFTPEQLAERRQGIGASEAAAAVGLSKWKSPLQLYLEKKGEAEPPDSERLQFEMGHAIEPMVVTRFAREMKKTVIGRQQQIRDPANPWRWVTMDGMTDDNELVEAKSTAYANPAEWGEPEQDDAVPMDYYAQVQHGLACTGFQIAWVPMVVLNREFRIYRVRRDDEFIELLTSNEREFWGRVCSNRPPEPRTVDDVDLLWPRVKNGVVIEATPEQALLCAQARALKDKKKEIEESEKALCESLKVSMRDATELVYGKKIIATNRQAKDSEYLDLIQLAIDKPEIIRAYTKTKPGFRRLLIK